MHAGNVHISIKYMDRLIVHGVPTDENQLRNDQLREASRDIILKTFREETLACLRRTQSGNLRQPPIELAAGETIGFDIHVRSYTTRHRRILPVSEILHSVH